MSEWRDISWSEFCGWVQGKTVVNGSGGHGPIEFTDGSKARFESHWSGPYSQLTPDIDAEPPTVSVREP